MRKRRVGVTARSRQNEGSQETGDRQFVNEMAAPLELRTPAGTCGDGCKSSAYGSMATKAQETTGRKQWVERMQGEEQTAGGAARRARMRRCLKLRQGASPLRPRAPFPWAPMIQNGGNRSRVRKPRNSSVPLTDRHRSEDFPEMRERGLSARRAQAALALKAKLRGGRARYARMRRCLILRQGASPLRPPPHPNYFLDSGGPSHGSRDRKGEIREPGGPRGFQATPIVPARFRRSFRTGETIC